MAQHVHTIRRTDFDRFHDEQYRVRRDFDKIFAENADSKLIELTALNFFVRILQTLIYWGQYYQIYVRNSQTMKENFRDCRQHSNLWGKMVLWGDKALATDHFGYYKPVLVHGEPSKADFTEQYPHMVGAWVYDHQYLNAEFNYNDLESEYLKKEHSSVTTASQTKSELDKLHQ